MQQGDHYPARWVGCPGPMDRGGCPGGPGVGRQVHRGGGRGWVPLGCVRLVFGWGSGWVLVAVLPGRGCWGAGM